MNAHRALRRPLAGLLPLLLCGLLLACGGAPTSPRVTAPVTSAVPAEAPSPDSFAYCFDHGCKSRHALALSPREWTTVAAVFQAPPRSAAAERERIAAAYAAFERLAGNKTGTAGDIGGTFPGFGREGQLDCIDEAVNTASFLRMVAAQGLLRHHEPATAARRGTLIDGWPHYAATLRETGSGRLYAVDPWFFDNGTTVLVMRLDVWLSDIDGGIDCLRRRPQPGTADSLAACGLS